jgi:hypothetical protein
MPKPKSDKNQSKSENTTPPPKESKLLAVVKRPPEPTPEVAPEAAPEATSEIASETTPETAPEKDPKTTPEVVAESLDNAQAPSAEGKQLLLAKPPAREKMEQPASQAVEASDAKTEANTSKEAPLKPPERPKRVISAPVSGGGTGGGGGGADYSRTEKPYKKSFDKKPQQPPYKKLETATNNAGEDFAVGEKILVGTSNFGEYSVVISFIYQAPDGSIWASYSPAGEQDQKHPWRWGCCRMEGLKKDPTSNEPQEVS